MIDITELKNFDFGQLINCMQSMGLVCEQIPESDVIKANYKDHVEYLVDYQLPDIPLGYKNIIDDKFFYKQILLDLDIPVHIGHFFNVNELELAIDYVKKEIGWPITIKPTTLQSGTLVFCAIYNEATLRKIWQENIINCPYGPFIVEQCWPCCPDYRFVIIPEQEPYIVKRSIPTITGDGQHSIQTLVDIENSKRGGTHRNSLCTISFNEKDDLRCLNDQGYTLTDIPFYGEEIRLKYVANLSKGGMSEMVDFNLVHSSYWPIFRQIWDNFPQLPILSVDILSTDISLPATAENMVVCEAHTTPGLGMFLAPGKGTGVNLYPSFARIIFPELPSCP